MSSFCTAKAAHIFFSKKFQHICISVDVNFNESLTNDVVSFEQLGPDNYRGITILSCFGKLFTAVLNHRLNQYLENMNILCKEQAGFRKNYSTTDHIFNLKCLIDLYLFRGKKLYCAFIDVKKAFDSVNRTYLWQKLLSNNIDGKMFRIIHNLYASAKSCVKQGHMKSTSFSSNVSVRQGENLSRPVFIVFE